MDLTVKVVKRAVQTTGQETPGTSTCQFDHDGTSSCLGSKNITTRYIKEA